VSAAGLTLEIAAPEVRRPARALHPLARLPEEWREYMKELGEPGFRGDQLFRWLHKDGVFEPARMTNLSQPLRQKLGELELSSPLVERSCRRSEDGTRKLLLELGDGLVIECVMIPRDRDDEDPDEDPGERAAWAAGRPVTLCVSTQVGCAMGCVFCASGQAGLKRGLGAHEIVGQVLAARARLDEGERLKNLVFMGMGEPLHHYAETARAIRLLTAPLGSAMSLRRITVSTVGLIPGIKKLGDDFAGKVGLAISLHASDTETRSRILPMNRRFPLDDLLEALRSYPLPKRRRITIEYTLILGVNDTIAHAQRLARILTGIPVKVNLIPMNPIDQSALGAPTAAGVEAFKAELARLRVSCSVRQQRGDDVDAACGQLALKAPTPRASA
jgi:23S rRNA (adenine2503-C2)-methyltransferase